MNHDTHITSAPQGFAPTAPAPEASALPDMSQAFAGTEPQGVVIPASSKRLKTHGEKRFDWGTYAGVAMLGNEAASLLITTQVERTPWHARQMAYFKSLADKKMVPEYVHSGGLMNVLIALVGGMTMVPFVKYLEDHKSEIVRNIDRKHYGKQADTDPAIVAAHKEMDEAPKQTWGSLWKGRLLTVFAAIGVDWLVGSEHAPSTKLLPNNATYQKFASMDRIAAQVSNGVMNSLNISAEARPTWNKWLQKGSWLLVLSSTLTVMFYASSKLFATRRDEKLERRDALTKNSIPASEPAKEPSASSELQSTTPEAPSSEQPRLHISNIAHQDTVASSPQLAHSV